MQKMPGKAVLPFATARVVETWGCPQPRCLGTSPLLCPPSRGKGLGPWAEGWEARASGTIKAQ